MPTQYATAAELVVMGVPDAALTGVTLAARNSALLAASAIVDSYVGERFKLPLTSYGEDLKRVVCKMAAWDILSVRGLSPGNASADTLRLNFEDAMRWLRDVQAGKATPAWPATSDANSYNPQDTGGAGVFVMQPAPGGPLSEGSFDRPGDGTGSTADSNVTVGTPQRPRSRGW